MSVDAETFHLLELKGITSHCKHCQVKFLRLALKANGGISQKVQTCAMV